MYGALLFDALTTLVAERTTKPRDQKSLRFAKEYVLTVCVAIMEHGDHVIGYAKDVTICSNLPEYQPENSITQKGTKT